MNRSPFAKQKRWKHSEQQPTAHAAGSLWHKPVSNVWRKIKLGSASFAVLRSNTAHCGNPLEVLPAKRTCEALLRRAISPVIAAILLVLITVSVGTSLYIWYAGVKEQAEAETEGKVRQDLTRVFAEVKIVEVNTTSKLVYIQNTGGTTLHAVKLYNGSVLLNSTSVLDISSYVSLGYTGTLSSGDTLYVTTAEGATDKYKIS